MSSLFLLNIFDVARALGSDPSLATPESVAAWLIEHYARKRGGGFNYNPAINCLFDLFRGASAGSAAVMHCLSSGNPKGRRQNAEAIKAVAPYAEVNTSCCYRIDFSAISVGRVKDRTVYIAVKAPMVRVVHDEAFIVLPGFRMSHRPVAAQIDLASSIALATFARDDLPVLISSISTLALMSLDSALFKPFVAARELSSTVTRSTGSWMSTFVGSDLRWRQD